MISVLIPVYNASRYLRQAVESILGQSYESFEIIAIDDGSTDISLKILYEYAAKDGRVQIISRPNSGIVGALNDGLSECQGEYIARMDADDWAHPERLARQIGFMQNEAEIVACGTAVHFTDPKGRPVKPCPRPTRHKDIVDLLLKGDGGAIIHPTLMVRRDAINKIGGYRNKALWIEDLDLYLRLSEIGKLANLEDYLLLYRQHPNSVNASKSNPIRLQRKNTIMAEAHVRRGSDWSPIETYVHPTKSELYQEWATESLGYGNWFFSTRYAILCVITQLWQRKRWRTLKYVLCSGYKIAHMAKNKPQERYRVFPC